MSWERVDEIDCGPFQVSDPRTHDAWSKTRSSALILGFLILSGAWDPFQVGLPFIDAVRSRFWPHFQPHDGCGSAALAAARRLTARIILWANRVPQRDRLGLGAATHPPLVRMARSRTSALTHSHVAIARSRFIDDLELLRRPCGLAHVGHRRTVSRLRRVPNTFHPWVPAPAYTVEPHFLGGDRWDLIILGRSRHRPRLPWGAAASSSGSGTTWSAPPLGCPSDRHRRRWLPRLRPSRSDFRRPS